MKLSSVWSLFLYLSIMVSPAYAWLSAELSPNTQNQAGYYLFISDGIHYGADSELTLSAKIRADFDFGWSFDIGHSKNIDTVLSALQFISEDSIMAPPTDYSRFALIAPMWNSSRLLNWIESLSVAFGDNAAYRWMTGESQPSAVSVYFKSLLIGIGLIGLVGLSNRSRQNRKSHVQTHRRNPLDSR